ncbi:hypothetical protein V7114_19505, partial [Neobacillus niacini]|uniref:hypothetical protein n=1 Tax=Neobacillus niacini TaxID=86668 RepID=UPI003000AC7B
KSNTSSSDNENSKPEYSSNNTYIKKFSDLSDRNLTGKRIDTNINGLDLVSGDAVKMKSGTTYKIIKKNSNGTITGINIGSNDEISLVVSANDNFILIAGVYVHEDLAGTKHSIKNKKQLKKEIDYSWKSKNYTGATRFMLRKNGSEEIEKIIAKMKLSDKIQIKRNKSGKTVINVYDNNNRLLGSIPNEISSSIAKKMDSGIKYDAKIIGAFGKDGLEILIWQNENRIGNQGQSNSGLEKSKKNRESNNNHKTSFSSNVIKKGLVGDEKTNTRISKNETIKQIQASDFNIADKIRLNNGLDYVIKDINLSKSGKNYNLTLQSLKEGKEQKKLVAYFDKYKLVNGVYISLSNTNSGQSKENIPPKVEKRKSREESVEKLNQVRAKTIKDINTKSKNNQQIRTNDSNNFDDINKQSKVIEIYLNEGKDLMLKLINIKNYTGLKVKHLIDDDDFQAFNGNDFYNMLMDDSLEDGTPILSQLDKIVTRIEKNVVTDFDKFVHFYMYLFCSTHRSYFDEIDTIYNTLNMFHSGMSSFERTKSRLKESHKAIVNSQHGSWLADCELAVSNASIK